MKLSLESLLMLAIYPTSIAALWWSFDMSGRLDSNSVCKRTQALMKADKTDFCRKKPELIKRVLNGVNRAVEECQYQFHHRKWNCSTNRNSIKKIVQQDYRETAFIFAITSAGISYYVTRACSMGELSACSCTPELLPPSSVSNPNSDASGQGESANQLQNRNTEFEWRGCKQNLKFGSSTSKKFMDSRKRGRDPRALVILHNNKAGRLAVQENMHKKCKCHGISGQCSQKTCWQTLPTFRKVSDSLKSKFDGATKVIISNKGNEILTEGDTIKPPTNYDLVYTTDSPDFCKKDPRTGSLGTQGRVCSSPSKAIDGCDLLCCQRGFKSSRVVEVVNCKCRFHWCCVVQCQACRQVQIIHRCNP